MVVLIPAYEPDERLVHLVGELVDEQPVVVVDDGSGAAFDAVFDAARTAGADVVRHPVNRGKGAALKTGFARIADRYPDADVVTADSDGQHTPHDIRRIADALADSGADLVLGVRSFTGAVPLRSRAGNAVARRAFEAATGYRVADTQTGLRGIPARMLPRLSGIAGDRFEYEQQVLLAVCRSRGDVVQVPIETIYLDRNAGSHFRPVRDSLRVLAPMLRFAGVGAASFLLDAALLQLLFWTTSSLVVSTVVARLSSAGVNFAANRRLVFGDRGPVWPALRRYGILAAVLLAAGVPLLAGLTTLGMPLLAAKVVGDLLLAAVGYLAQRRVVFRGGGQRAAQLRPARLAPATAAGSAARNASTSAGVES